MTTIVLKSGTELTCKRSVEDVATALEEAKEVGWDDDAAYFLLDSDAGKVGGFVRCDQIAAVLPSKKPALMARAACP